MHEPRVKYFVDESDCATLSHKIITTSLIDVVRFFNFICTEIFQSANQFIHFPLIQYLHSIYFTRMKRTEILITFHKFEPFRYDAQSFYSTNRNTLMIAVTDTSFVPIFVLSFLCFALSYEVMNYDDRGSTWCYRVLHMMIDKFSRNVHFFCSIEIIFSNENKSCVKCVSYSYFAAIYEIPIYI